MEGGQTATYASGFVSSVPLTIGYSSAVGGFHYAGVLDEIALYGRAITEVEIFEHYLDGGNGLGIGTISTDFEGEQRVFNGIVDMGADEFVDADSDLLPDSWEYDNFGNLATDGNGGSRWRRSDQCPGS